MKYKTNTIKKLFFVMIFISLFSSVFSSKVILSTEDVFPSTVMPGEDIVVQLNLNNQNDEEIDINDVEINLKDYFTLKTVNEDYKGEQLCSKCSKTLIYYIKSKSGIESGIYPIDIEVTYNSVFSVKEEVSIKVVGEPNLVIDSIIDENIYPNGIFNISFNITNHGSNDANNIKIISNSNEIGFLNKNSLYINKIKQRESKTINGILISSDDIKTGFYQIPFLIKYEDNQNNKYELQENLGINILNKANIIIQNLKLPTQINFGEPFELNLRLENDGFGEAKNVNIELIGDFEGNKKGFFGTIEKGEDLPQIFNLIPKKEGANTIDLILTYEDDYGKHETTQKIEVNVIQNNKKNEIYILCGVGILFLVIIGIIVLKKSNKKEEY